ncbi:Uncharacterized protein Fot_04068 [Forsythia ovata]|uniref:Uncharacterized protein n=1 Tax=Forsythia ovata TaxID=205694 RepID=A0ABD1XBI0_9LAMI
MHPNALNSTSYDKNLDMGPSPMISEASKTPKMVSPTSNLTGINTLENVHHISIRDPVGPTKLHAPDPQLGNVILTTRPKFQPDRTSDVPTQQTVGPDSRHVRPTIDFSHSINMGPSLETPLPAGPSHLSTAPSYISSLLPTPILSVSQSLDVSRPVDPAIVPSSHVGPTTDLLPLERASRLLKQPKPFLFGTIAHSRGLHGHSSGLKLPTTQTIKPNRRSSPGGSPISNNKNRSMLVQRR